MPDTPPAQSPSAITPPDLDEVRRLLRPNIVQIPDILAQWPDGEGPLADVPLLDPGMVAPRAFSELAGTVRVARTTPTLITMAGLLDLPDGGLLVTAIAVGPADLANPPQVEASRQALAEAGVASSAILVEIVALLSPLADEGGPAAGVGIVRALVLANPAAFPDPRDPTPYSAEVVAAASAAVAEDREVVSDLAGSPLVALSSEIAGVWSPMFEVGRSATVGLAARGAGTPAEDGGVH